MRTGTPARARCVWVCVVFALPRSPSFLSRWGVASACDRFPDPYSPELRAVFPPPAAHRLGGTALGGEPLEITTTRDSIENIQESGSVSPIESEGGDGRCGDEEVGEDDSIHRAAVLFGARVLEEAETGDEETLSPLAIDAIVADAYESFSDEDSLMDATAAGKAEKRRIKLPKIGGVYYKRDGNYKAWAASWHIQGKRTRRYFTVKKHGFK